MSEIKVDVSISPEDIQRQVVDAILHSSIGERIHERVTALEKEWKTKDYFGYAIQSAIEAEVKTTIADLVHTKLRPDIERAVMAKVTPKVIDDAVTQVWKRVVGGW